MPEKHGKVLSVHYFSPDRPKITKELTVDLALKTIKFKQLEFRSFKFIQGLRKVYMRLFFFFFFFFFLFCFFFLFFSSALYIYK